MDEEKKKIYSHYVNKDDVVYNNLAKITKDNVNINQYLDYKLSEFKSDDDPNSNIVGKTIRGSKKKKVINYLENSGFSEIERLYIEGREYTLDDTDKQKFLKYLKETQLSLEERIEILKDMKGIKEYEDGDIKW